MGLLELTRPANPDRIRLCVYTDSDVFGGAEQQLGQLLSELSTAMDVTVLGIDRQVVDRVAAHRATASAVVVRPVRSKLDVRGIWLHRRAIARVRPHILHANLTWLLACRYAIFAALTVRGVRVVAVEHSVFQSDDPGAIVLKRWLSRRLAAHVAVGRAVGATLEQRIGLEAGSIRVIPNGVPPLKVSPHKVAGKSIVVGTVARLDKAKGVDVLLDAVASLDEVTVVVVGDGPERDALVQRAAANGMTHRVKFAGWVDDAREWVAGFDLFVLPSYSEAMPLTVIEAMQAGVPVVATAVGSVPEIVVDGETGVLVEAGDADALGRAIGDLLADPERRAHLATAGRRHAVAELTSATMARSYEALYRELLAPAGSTARRRQR